MIKPSPAGPVFKFNGGWELRPGRIICRWMLVWADVTEGEIAGCAAGYSGGGSFQMEKFYLKHRRGTTSLLQIDNQDKVTGEFADFSIVVPPSVVTICEDCQDELLSWHDQDKWEDSDNLCLREGLSEELILSGDMLFNNNAKAGTLVNVLEYIGITARPLA